MIKNLRLLIVFAVVALLIVILYWLSEEWTEWFSGGEELFMVFEQLSIAYIASFIVFILIEYIPYKRKKKVSENGIDIILYRIHFDMHELLTYLLFNHGLRLEYKKPLIFDTEELSEELVFEVQDGRNISSLMVGSNFAILQEISPEIVCLLTVESIENNINRLQYYFEYLDEDLVNILIWIKSSDLIETIKVSKTKEIFTKFIRTRKEEIKTFYDAYKALVSYMHKKEYPITGTDIISRHKDKTK